MRRAVIAVVLATLVALPSVAIAADPPTLQPTRDTTIAFHQASPRPATTIGQADTITSHSRGAPEGAVRQGIFCPNCNSWLGQQPVVRCPYCDSEINRPPGPREQG